MLHQPMTREQACLVAKRLHDTIVEDAVDAFARRMIAAMEGM